MLPSTADGLTATPLDAELLDEARRTTGRQAAPTSATREPLLIQTTVTIATVADAAALRQRQIAAIVRILRHAVESKRSE
jgi:hypothetical protein